MSLKLKVQVWIHSGDRVLLLKTIPERGAYWQPVTGGVEDGESLAQAAWREAMEETGLHFSGDAQPLGFDFEFPSRYGSIHESAFSLAVTTDDPQVKVDPVEHSEYRWVNVAQAMPLLKFDSNRQALTLLAKQKGLT